jgi:hypothetical protein
MSSAVAASPITITNASFEDDPVFTDPSGWTGRGPAPAHTSSSNGGGLTAPDGLLQLIIGNGGDGASYSDNLASPLMANTTYTLSGYVGWRTDDPNPVIGFDRIGSIQLVQGGVGASATGSLLLSLVKSSTDIGFALGTYYFLSGSFQTGDVVSGDALRIELISNVTDSSGIQTWFDDIQLDAEPVPEPATLSLFGAGLLLVGHHVRTRRRSPSQRG